MSRPATLVGFGRALRKLINNDAVFKILAEGDWGAGGCWILADAVARWLGPPARLLAVRSPKAPVEHVVVEYADLYIDYHGAQTEKELHASLVADRIVSPRLVPFTEALQKKARATGIPCETWQVRELLSALNRRFA
jgi:hypothetical protein